MPSALDSVAVSVTLPASTALTVTVSVPEFSSLTALLLLDSHAYVPVMLWSDGDAFSVTDSPTFSSVGTAPPPSLVMISVGVTGVVSPGSSAQAGVTARVSASANARVSAPKRRKKPCFIIRTPLRGFRSHSGSGRSPARSRWRLLQNQSV